MRDVNSLMSDSSKWTHEDKLLLESKLALIHNPKLCLDPSPKVMVAANRIQYCANKFNHKGLKRLGSSHQILTTLTSLHQLVITQSNLISVLKLYLV